MSVFNLKSYLGFLITCIGTRVSESRRVGCVYGDSS